MSSESGEGSSTSASVTKEKMDAQLQASNMLAQGKRNLICSEVPAAVQQFQDACQILSSTFGEMARECAEAYFCYGKGLLELSRMEQGVLGNALEGVDVDTDDEGGPNNKDQFEPANKTTGEGKDAEEMEDTEEEDEEEGEEEEEENAEEGQENEDDPDDISNLQLSWEMLDLARIIYSKDPSKESQLSAAEACLKLGEVSMESEQYDQAIKDLENCLDMQKQNLESQDRAIAETYYHLGLAYQMNKQLDKAKDSFSSSLACLQTKMEHLKVLVEQKLPKSPSQSTDPAQELDQLLVIIPEIQEKIQDIEEENKTMENLKMMAKVAMGSIFSSAADSTSETGCGTSSTGFGTSSTGFGTSSTGFGTSSASPVKSSEVQKTSDISHLIRKKRKPEEERKQEEEVVENKKAKPGGSGDSGVNGVNQEKDSTSEAVAAT